MKAFAPSKHAVTACRPKSAKSIWHLRMFSSAATQQQSNSTNNATVRKSQDISAILSKPTWSARSLLPSTSPSPQSQEEVTPKQLHHLLRLSALPQPKSPAEERRMIDVLQSQLRFVRDVQAVDTAGLAPLRSVRDETAEGLREAAVGVEQVSAALAEETAFGHSRRPRRRKKEEESEGAEPDGWDVLSTASRRAGKYFVVKSGKDEDLAP